MYHRYRSFVSLMLTIAWLMHPATLSLAVEQAPPLRGTVSMVVTSLALVVGAEWGKGILSLADGTQHRFTVKGIELGGAGWRKPCCMDTSIISRPWRTLPGCTPRPSLVLPSREGRAAWPCATNAA